MSERACAQSLPAPAVGGSERRSSASLKISTLVVGDTAVGRLAGDLDHVTASRVRPWAAPIFATGARNMVIDCTGVSSLDPAALDVLVEHLVYES